ncbi:MAG: ATP-binding protein [Thalassobius sp.]|nr:ATP-binding protein [Thalassovita sp.]
MFYKRFSFQIVIRIAFLFLTLLGFTIIFGNKDLFFNQIILGIIIVGQVFELLNYVNRTNRELQKFLDAIKHSDYTVNFTSKKLGNTFQGLDKAYESIINSYKQVKIEREAQFHFLEVIVAHIDVGIISVKNNHEIVLINDSACRLLKVPKLKNWKHLQQKNLLFAETVESIFDGGKKLIEIAGKGETRSLSINVTPITLIEEPYVVITLQDINTEIEQKELEAWNKLIRILTHEIMNSLTPVASLTETILMLLENGQGSIRKSDELEDEQIEDIHFSLQTILRRSEGMLHFVEDYRKLTRIPVPEKSTISVEDVFESVRQLLQVELNRNNVKLLIEVAEENQEIFADQRLIEQILINLINNAIHATEEVDHPQITLKFFERDKEKVIQVIDNGSGIDEDKMSKIFIPFYSTKSNGSGIGLSLSRNIMNLHNGTLQVHSEKGKGAVFSLIFR